MPTFRIVTYGCKANQYESAALREALLAGGWSETETPGGVDVLLVNTCAVTARAATDGARELRRMRRKDPGARVALTGCAVDLDEPWTRDATLAVRCRNRDKHGLPMLLGRFFLSGARPTPPEIPGDPRFAFALSRFGGHTRAFLKIQDGCANHCAYCAVPRARGLPASRAPEAVVEEARRLWDSGHREIALTGINIGAYDAGDGRGLAWLARQIASALPDLRRLRLGSVEPPAVDDALVEALRSVPALCPHVHLPLQSGDNRILVAMNRRYDAETFLRTVERLRREVDRRLAVTTDVIVGFPGEDDAAFERTLAVCQAASFSRIHVFPYSPRPGTPAADHQPPPPADVAARRRRLVELGACQAAAYAESFVGEPIEVLVEAADPTGLLGYTRHYVPVRRRGFGGETPREGRVLSYRAEEASEGMLWVDMTRERTTAPR